MPTDAQAGGSTPNFLPATPDVRTRAGSPTFDLSVRLVELCPNCKAKLPHRQCHFTFSTWRCFGCGAVLDSRVVSPIYAKPCENAWPDYKREFGEPEHPLACSCTGRGWYPIKED